MPDPKDNAKASGDVHPPEVEDRARGTASSDAGDDTPPDGTVDRDLQDEGRAGKGINQAGYLKDKDAPGTGGGGDRTKN